MALTTKHLLLTYDYELFLGARSGQVEDCQIIPTNQLLGIMQAHEVKGIFFVDTTHLLRLKAMAAQHQAAANDLDLITTQLQHIIQGGHYVFPHIHPHWLDAVYVPDQNEWQLNNTSKYRFHNCTLEERTQLFGGSMALLKEIIHPVAPDYKINGYRAGGWCIQPFEDFKPFFEKHGIRYEFSVLSGHAELTQTRYYDFRKAPQEYSYPFEHEVTERQEGGAFQQISISSVRVPAFTRFRNKVGIKMQWKLFNDRPYGSGEGVKAEPQQATLSVPEDPALERVAIELLTSAKLGLYLDFLKRHAFMHFISHPKMVSPHNLMMLDRFLQKARQRHIIESDFQKMITT